MRCDNCAGRIGGCSFCRPAIEARDAEHAAALAQSREECERLTKNNGELLKLVARDGAKVEALEAQFGRAVGLIRSAATITGHQPLCDFVADARINRCLVYRCERPASANHGYRCPVHAGLPVGVDGEPSPSQPEPAPQTESAPTQVIAGYTFPAFPAPDPDAAVRAKARGRLSRAWNPEGYAHDGCPQELHEDGRCYRGSF